MEAKGVKKRMFSHTQLLRSVIRCSEILDEHAKLFDERIGIDAMRIAGLLKRLGAGQRAAEAVHADVLKHLANCP